MYTADTPECCTATFICEFAWDRYWNDKTEKDLKEYLDHKIKHCFQDGDAVLLATCTTFQEKARKVLMEKGFICSEKMPKKRHKDRDLYLLYLPLAAWAKSKAPIIPRDEKGRFVKANPFK